MRFRLPFAFNDWSTFKGNDSTIVLYLSPTVASVTALGRVIPIPPLTLPTVYPLPSEFAY